MKFPVTFLASFNLSVVTILLFVKSFHYILFKRNNATFATYLYYDQQQLISTGDPRATSHKRFQNLLSSLLAFFILLQLLFSILYILLS